MHCRVICALIIGTVVAAAAPSSVVNNGDISVTMMPHLYFRQHGYAEHICRVENKSGKATKSVTLIMRGRRVDYGNEARLTELRRTVAVGPAATLNVPLYQPSVEFYCYEFEVIVDGSSIRSDVSLPGNSGYAGRYQKQPVVYASRRLNSDDLDTWVNDKVTNAVKTSSLALVSRPRSYSSVNENDVLFVKSESEPAGWSSSWLAYSGFDAIVMQPADYAELTAPTRAAIDEYVRCGGILTIMGAEAPEELAASAHFAERDGMKQASIGFGCAMVTGNDSVMAVGRPQLLNLREQFRSARTVWGNNGFDQMLRDVPVIESLKVPVRGMLLLMVVFSVVIGPVNLIVLAKLKRRIWMLWTVPVISLITCIGVFVHAFMAEGVTPSVRTEGITLLDQRTGQASTYGVAGCYAPLTPRNGISFDPWAELTPVGESRRDVTMDWTSDQRLDSGWISARIPAYFIVRKSEQRRERLQVSRGTDGQLKVINGLGAPIVRLWLADENGALYQAMRIEAGAEATLSPAGRTTTSVPYPVLRTMFVRIPASKEVSYALLQPASLVDRNMYLAELDGSPFMDPMFDQNTKRSAKQVVRGTLPESSR